MANAKARVLSDWELEGINYNCNDVIEASKETIKAHKSILDDSKSAVEYCINELGVKIKKHGIIDSEISKA